MPPLAFRKENHFRRVHKIDAFRRIPVSQQNAVESNIDSARSAVLEQYTRGYRPVHVKVNVASPFPVPPNLWSASVVQDAHTILASDLEELGAYPGASKGGA